MSLSSKLKKLYKISLSYNNVFCKVQYLFILSHMRSRSSVLAHILGSNSQIIGYSENHRSYRNKNSLIDLKLELDKEFKEDFSDKFLLDKLLHNRYRIFDEIIQDYQPKIIFLIRDPEETFLSLKSLGIKLDIKAYQDFHWMLDYYRERLLYFQRMVTTLNIDFYFIDSNDLIEKPTEVLDNLSSWLKLSTPLDNKYEKFNNTGVGVFGDPSPNIFEGFLVRTPTNVGEVPPEILVKAKIYFKECTLSLTSHH